jgi:transcriptional regulator with XRE-family HTH domain
MRPFNHDRDVLVNTNVMAAAPVMRIMDDGSSATLGQRVRWARERRGLSQHELAERIGVRQSTIGNIESGTRRRPREQRKLADALGVNELWLETGRGQRDRDAGDTTRLSEDETDLILAYRILDGTHRSELLADVLQLVQNTTPFGNEVRHLLRERFGAGDIASPERVAARLPAAPSVQQARAVYRKRRSKT